jgi:hypothetical protein
MNRPLMNLSAPDPEASETSLSPDFINGLSANASSTVSPLKTSPVLGVIDDSFSNGTSAVRCPETSPILDFINGRPTRGSASAIPLS